MSYITGNLSTFSSRMHELSVTVSDLSGSGACFYREGISYSGVAGLPQRSKWTKEFSKPWELRTRSGISGILF